MPSIFISYRRSDRQDVAGRIYDRLVQHFGREAIFKDVDDIPGGEDFRIFLQSTLQQCKVLLAIIGPDWLNALDGQGRRRLDNPADWVRMEIEESLSRDDVLVLPVLVSNAAMPRMDELPDGMKNLVYRNYRQARPDPDFHKDVGRLIIDLERHVEQTRPPAPPVVTEIYTSQQRLDNTSQQRLDNYRDLVRQYLKVDNGELTPVSRGILNGLRNHFGITDTEAEALEQEERQPYLKKAEAIANYRKVFADTLQYEYPPSEGTCQRLRDFQQLLELTDHDVQGIEAPLLQQARKEAERQRQEAEAARQQKEAAERERRQAAEAERQRQAAQNAARQREAEAEARRRAEAEEARRIAEVRRRKPESTSQRRQSPELLVAPTLTRQQFLKWGGLSGLGILTAFGISRAFSGEQRSDPERLPVAEPDASVPDSAPPTSTNTNNDSAQVDYTRLEELLDAGEWKEADQETLNLMLKIANRQKEGWLDLDSFRNFPCDALGRIDQLWVDASEGRFGFSVQKEIYIEECGGTPDGQHDEAAWRCLADKVGWRVNEVWISYSEVTFDTTTAPIGHLPGAFGLQIGWLRYRSGRSPSSLMFRLVNCSIP